MLLHEYLYRKREGKRVAAKSTAREFLTVAINIGCPLSWPPRNTPYSQRPHRHHRSWIAASLAGRTTPSLLEVAARTQGCSQAIVRQIDGMWSATTIPSRASRKKLRQAGPAFLDQIEQVRSPILRHLACASSLRGSAAIACNARDGWEAIGKCGIVLDLEKGSDIGVLSGISHNTPGMPEHGVSSSFGINAPQLLRQTLIRSPRNRISYCAESPRSERRDGHSLFVRPHCRPLRLRNTSGRTRQCRARRWRYRD